MAPQDDELVPENTSGYKLSQPKHTLEEYQKMGESTKQSLFLLVFLLFPFCLGHILVGNGSP